jgi:hypothetical protein
VVSAGHRKPDAGDPHVRVRRLITATRFSGLSLSLRRDVVSWIAAARRLTAFWEGFVPMYGAPPFP